MTLYRLCLDLFATGSFPRGGGVLALYMTGGPTELHIASLKKYTSLKFYNQKNT